MNFENQSSKSAGEAQIGANSGRGSGALSYQLAHGDRICRDPYAVDIGQDNPCPEGYVYPNDPDFNRIVFEARRAAKENDEALKALAKQPGGCVGDCDWYYGTHH